MPTEKSRQGNRQKTRERDQKKPKPSVFQSLRRRDILILTVFWLTSACVVGLILVFFFLRSANSPGKPMVELKEGDVTAQKLYPVAEEAARAWESDTQYVSASASWGHASLASLEEPAEWVYRFYSPGLQRILFVIVTPEQDIIVRPHLKKVRRELKIIDPEQWVVDSPAALSSWLNNGGNSWLQGALNPTVSAQLTYNPIKEELEWTVSGLDLETGQQFNHTTRGEAR